MINLAAIFNFCGGGFQLYTGRVSARLAKSS